MANIYAMSDIHGHYKELQNSLKLFDLKTNPCDKLIFVGDYVDNGEYSYEVLNKIMELENQYSQQVIVLLGNHDEWLCDWLFHDYSDLASYATGFGNETVRSFIDLNTYLKLTKNISSNLLLSFDEIASEINGVLRNELLQNSKYQALIKWLMKKYKEPRFYETDSQIFVHAGIDEEAEEFWQWGTPEETFTGKYPVTKGKFYKYIISGHVHSDEVAMNVDYLGKVFWDTQSHFFIDGNTGKSGIVPVLVYDTEHKSYSSFEKSEDGTWRKIRITQEHD
ncbi:MAG TPA: metallophosphoesterase [Lactovum miscens]|uniref:metallophosphoesterase n=1 Tax=Lactovum miscens TaxID=190387 RepID=UPI002ED87FAB